MKSITLFVFVLCLVAPPSGEAKEGNVPFEEFLASFLEAHQLSDTPEGDAGLNHLLDTGYVVVRMGSFDLWYPGSFLKKSDYAKQFQATAGAVLDMQIMSLHWMADEATGKAWDKKAKALHKWIRSWKFSKLPKMGEIGQRPDLAVLLKTKPAIAEDLESFARLMTGGEYLGIQPEDEEPILLIFSPNREDFVGLGSFIGNLSEENRRILWTDGLAMWTSYNRSGIHVIGLEHPASFPGKGDIKLGTDMNAKEKTGMVQHIVQLAMELFINSTYSRYLSSDLVNGLAMIMVVELYGENNVRAGGGSGGSSTAAFSRFVPGGASSGGNLPGRSAENRWRRNLGKGCFLNALKVAQKDGARAAAKGSDKTAFFTLESSEGEFDYSVQAPFFFVVTDREPVPQTYVNDFQEFFRAYRCAFGYWLLNEADGELLKTALAKTAETGSSFEDAVKSVYSMPFSGKDGSIPSLEWRFLQWLSKGK